MTRPVSETVYTRRAWAEWVARHKRIPYPIRRTMIYNRHLTALVWRREEMESRRG